MKLYTEEQVKRAMVDSYIIGTDREDNCLQIEEYMLKKLTPIELPSDDEIANASNHCKDGQVKVGFLRGVLWLKEQILNQNK